MFSLGVLAGLQNGKNVIHFSGWWFQRDALHPEHHRFCFFNAHRRLGYHGLAGSNGPKEGDLQQDF